MIFPRLVLADERKNGVTPPSIMLLAAMKRAGFPLRIFYCGQSCVDICLMKNAVEDDITVLNPKTIGNPKIMKVLFELSAAQDKLNVIVCELGRRGETYMNCTKDMTASDMAAMFDCSIVMCCYAESIPNPIGKIVTGFVEGLEAKNPNVHVDGIVFINQFDQRSFQLVENNIGFNFKGLSFGYLPQELVPQTPKYENLCSASTNFKSIFSIRAATTRISQMHRQIEYNLIEAIGKYYQAWTPVDNKIEPIKRTNLPTVAIIEDIALNSEGNNAETLFKAFGCKVDRLPAEAAFSGNYDAHYFPHGLGHVTLQSYMENPKLIANIKGAFLSNKIIFTNGGSTQIFAETVMLPDNTEIEGIGILAGAGVYSNEYDTEKCLPVQCESMGNGIMLKYKEKIGGYSVPWAKMARTPSMQKIVANWLCSPIEGNTPLGSAGWESRGTIFAGVCVDLWSNTEAVRKLFYAKV